MGSRGIRALNPFPKPFPLATFPKRTWRKLLFVYGPIMRFSGGSAVSVAPNGNVIVQLNRTTPLGEKGDQIQVPEDGIIFKEVIRYGLWELQESQFLAIGLKECPSTDDTKTVLIDIGANCGLITRQALSLSNSDCDVVLFEPLKLHTDAIEFNLKSKRLRNSIKIEQAGLGDADETVKFFTDLSNKGNSSVFSDLITDANYEVSEIQLLNTQTYFETHISNYDCVILKSDTQGLDASILSRIPSSVWEKIQRAVIEVWAIPGVQTADVDVLISIFEKHFYMSWEGLGSKISIDELRNLWLSQSDQSKNLFLRKI